MFLIDYPYVSAYLKDTIKKNNYPVVSTAQARILMDDEALAWISEEDAAKRIRENTDTPLYSNSENALRWIAWHLGDSVLSNQVQGTD